jgi:hypothetical protein
MSMCVINDPSHTCDEYMVLLAKSGVTVFNFAFPNFGNQILHRFLSDFVDIHDFCYTKTVRFFIRIDKFKPSRHSRTTGRFTTSVRQNFFHRFFF